MENEQQHSAQEWFSKLATDAEEAAAKLGLPPNFILGIVAESDWSFVVKLHALFESALEQVIFDCCFASTYQRPRDNEKLRKFCSALNFSGRTGKIALLRAFELIDKDVADDLQKIAELRNKFVHGVSGSTLTIMEIARSSGNEERFFKDILGIPLGTITGDRDIRFLIAVKAMSMLWRIEYRTRPPTSLLDYFVAKAREDEQTATLDDNIQKQ